MRTRRSTALVGILAAGLVFTQQACTSATTSSPASSSGPSSGPSSGGTSAADSGAGDAAPSPSRTAGGGGGTTTADPVLADPILAGKRQVVIKPIPSAESIVAVDPKGRLNLTDGEAEHGMFVLTPAGDKFLIRTAKAGTGGEPSCMGVKNNGSASLTVVAAACDAGRDGQLFTITRQKNKDNGRPTYAISNQSAFLQVSAQSGLIAEELGDAPLRTTYSFVDNGPSTLPSLD